MCSACHHQLLVLSSDFNNKLNNFRLERAAMTKEVTLAIKEREILMKERKITEERLESVKKTLESMKGGNLDQLNHERLVNNEMNDKVEDLSSQSKESQEKLLLLQQKLSDKKRKLAKFKEKREEQKKSSQEIIREIEQLKFACSKLKVVKHDENCTEEEILEKIIFLNEEIQVIQEKLSEKNALNSEVFQILTELLSKINENEEILSDVNEKFQNLRSAPQTLTEQEKEILENLKNQIKQQDDLISITKAQAQHRNSRLSLRTSHISLRSSQHPGVPSLRYNISSDLLQSANSSQYSIIPADETLQEGQRRCQSCLLL
jgi:chromosome segregation ATPase